MLLSHVVSFSFWSSLGFSYFSEMKLHQNEQGRSPAMHKEAFLRLFGTVGVAGWVSSPMWGQGQRGQEVLQNLGSHVEQTGCAVDVAVLESLSFFLNSLSILVSEMKVSEALSFMYWGKTPLVSCLHGLWRDLNSKLSKKVSSFCPYQGCSTRGSEIRCRGKVGSEWIPTVHLPLQEPM